MAPVITVPGIVLMIAVLPVVPVRMPETMPVFVALTGVVSRVTGGMKIRVLCLGGGRQAQRHPQGKK